MQNERDSSSRHELDNAFDKIKSELIAGLRHGFFRYRINCEIGSKKTRQLTLECGRSYKFHIHEGSLPST